MIIIKIMGGLGNQMFQYAMGRRLSLERNVTLKLDLSTFQERLDRKFELDQFNIPSNLGLNNHLYLLPPFSRKGLIDKVYYRLEAFLPENLRFSIEEKRMGFFDKKILDIKGTRYFNGYWQSEKYFDSIKDQIRADFTLKQPLSAQDQELADEMGANPCSVSVHIRRGDYISDYRFIRRFLVCTPDYYTETMNLMLNKLGKDVVFYIFSDDPEWCRNGINYPSNFKIVSDGKRSHSQELILMSRCRNAILTNSSFSWWGAWLNENTDKVVIYPKIWFYNQSAPDIPQPDWIPWQHNTKNDWKYIDIPFTKSRYFSIFEHELDFKNPKRFTEKIQWINIYDRKLLYSIVSDRVSVRGFISKKIGIQYLPKLYGVFNSSNAIDWFLLPNSFVLKLNHGPHMVIRCKNKNRVNKEEISHILNSWTEMNYYYFDRQWLYKDILPKIICEEYLAGDHKLGLIEYGFWCFNGQSKYIEVSTYQNTSLKRSLFDLNWNKLEVKIGNSMMEKVIPRPKQLGEMINISNILAKEFPFIRISLYNFNNRIIFEEMTTSPEVGFQKIQPPDFDLFLGKALNLHKE